MARNPLEAELLAQITRSIEEGDSGVSPLQRTLEAHQMERENPGFLQRANRFLGNVFGDPDGASLEFGANERDIEQFRSLLAGAASPVIEAGEAILQIPGLVSTADLPTDKAARYLSRVNAGMLTRAEASAIQAGLSPEAVGDVQLFGELIGYTAPTLASLKMARLLTRTPGTDLSFGRNFLVDSTAGLIFGSTLQPEEEVPERIGNALQEMALFGAGALVLSGPLYAYTGWKYNRAAAFRGAQQLDSDLRRIANGERVTLTDDGALDLVQLLNEEGFLASSPEAYALLETGAMDAALIQAIRGTAEAGMSRGVAREIASDFQSAVAAADRLKGEFPNLKFDVIKQERATGTTFDVHFGLTGLNNQQRSQLAREGRYAGQTVQKGDASYQYVRRGKNGRLVVRTVDGRVTSLRPEGVTDLPVGVEDVPLPTAGQALYEDFRVFAFDKIRQAADATGGLSETDIVRFIRQGQLGLTDDGARLFESPGSVTHPTEIGHLPSGRRFAVQMNELSPEGASFSIIDAQGQEVGNIVGGFLDDVFQIIDMGLFDEFGAQGAIGTGTIRDLARSIVEQFRVQGVDIRAFTGVRSTGAQPGRVAGLDVEDLMRGGSSASDFQHQYLREGAHGNGLLEPVPTRRMNDVFDSWLRERNLPVDAADVDAFRANFFQQIRSDIWALVPEEDLAAMRRVQEETFRLIEAQELPFSVRAGSKGFHVERGAGGEVALRDINTGTRLHFANEEVAERALNRVIRGDKDPMFDFTSPGVHGGQAFTTGLDPSDGVFTPSTNVSPDEMSSFLPTESITNRSDFLQAMEQVSGVPVWTQGFSLIDEGMIRMQRRLDPIANRIASTWKGLNRNQRKQVAEFWVGVEGSDLTGQALVRAAREAGLDAKQIRAFSESRKLYDLGAEMLGLPESRYIPVYYSRIQPYILEHGVAPQGRELRRLLSDSPGALKEFELYQLMQRTGDLSMIELDPEIVMHKYFRGMLYSQEVAPLEEGVRKMMNLQIRQLNPSQQRAVLQRSLPSTDANSFVFPSEVRATLQEYLNNIRGNPRPGLQAARRFGVRSMEALGIKIDPRVVDEFYNTLITMPYGAAIGARVGLLNRNSTQNYWAMYSRVGGRHAGEALEIAMKQVGYDEALSAGAIREFAQTLPEADAIFEAFYSTDVARGTGPLSHAAASVIRRAVRTGRVSRTVAQKFLVPYGSSEQINRSWAYWWQKLHTAEKLTEFESGALSWEGFLEDGLPFFSDSIKKGFRERFDGLGREAALQWIGKQAADEAHFIYASGAAPTWMTGFFGKLFGIFGQWPLWAKQLYYNRMAHATPKQVGQFWARTVAVAGVFGNFSYQTGVSMMNWLAPLSLGFSGGPHVDMALTARDIWSGPLDQKASATRRLAEQVGALALPGQLFYNEISESLDASDPSQALLLLTLGRASDRFNFHYDFTSNPDEVSAAPPPSVQRNIGSFPSIEELIQGPGTR